MERVVNRVAAELFNEAAGIEAKLPNEQTIIDPPLFRILPAITSEGFTYTAIERPRQLWVCTHASTYPARISKIEIESGEEILRSFFAGPGNTAWDQYQDKALWDALARACAELSLDAESSRKLSDATALCVLARRGAVAKVWDLA
jgi:hypothetical protein